MNLTAILFEQLKRHEGFRSKPYRDSIGKLTIGFGRNLDDVGIDGSEAEILLEADIDRALDAASRFIWFRLLETARQSVVVNMIFNLGLQKFSGFKNMIRFIELKNYALAAKEMLNSKWASQVGDRAKELAQIMETGEIPKSPQQGG